MGVVVAQIVVDYTEGTLMSGYYEPFMRRLAAPLLGEQTFAYRLLVGDFGLLTMTVTYLIGLLLPLVTGFYLALSFLEDSGYLPRIAFLTDRILNKIGLNGRAVIPMILGLGCVTMATLTTRVLSSRRERTIALALLGIAIPCSAQLGVIASLVTPLGVRALLTYVLVILFVYGLVGTLLNKILPGCSSDLLLDLPPLRFPGLGNIVKKTSARVYGFLWEAAPIFAGGVVLVAVMQESGVLLTIQQALTPITVHWLQLPASSAQAFVMGLVRRDFGAAGLYALPMSATQKLTASITITLFVPCVASMLVMWKERGWREAAAIFGGSLIIAVGVGGLASRLVSWLAPLIITSV
jgi:ferrous iron transport protein B